MIILKEQNEGGRLDESPLHRRLDGDNVPWYIIIVAFNGIVPKLALLVPWRLFSRIPISRLWSLS